MSAEYTSEEPQQGEEEKSSLGRGSFELEENHFSPHHHADVLSMQSVEEIETAIVKCKESILSIHEPSEEKRVLVQRLVRLRLRHQELVEIDIYKDPAREIKMIQSHRFSSHGVLQLRLNSSQIYCETCSGLIWIPVQHCFVCSECGYVSHGKCLNHVRRVCAVVKVADEPQYVPEICPERTLESQNYKCAECKARITFETALNQPFLCDYSGEYFCKDCHWGATSVIPARVISNWDFQKYPVSQSSSQFLKLMVKKPIIDLEAANPRLYSFVDELALVKRLRKDMMIMKEYILTCKDALEKKLLRLLETRQHFVENADHYSLQDLVDVSNKDLISYLEPIYRQFEQHITRDCAGCKGKGHVCRICDQPPVLFPFETCAALCNDCRSVYHRSCLSKKESACPKCSTKQLISN